MARAVLRCLQSITLFWIRTPSPRSRIRFRFLKKQDIWKIKQTFQDIFSKYFKSNHENIILSYLKLNFMVQFKNFKENLTIWWIKYEMNFKFIEKITYSFADLIEELIVNEKLFKNYSKKVIDYVFLHEVGHKKLHILYNILSWMILIPSLFLSLISVLYTVLTLYDFIVNRLINSCAKYIIVLWVLLILVSITIRKLNELNAELFALNYLDLEMYIEAKKELKDKNPSTIKQKLRSIFFYPSEYQVLRIRQLLRSGCKDEKNS